MSVGEIPPEVQNVFQVALAKIRQACREANEDLREIGEVGRGYDIILAAIWCNDPKSHCDVIWLDCPIVEGIKRFEPETPGFSRQAPVYSLSESGDEIEASIPFSYVLAAPEVQALAAEECCAEKGKAVKKIVRPGRPPFYFCGISPNC